MSIISIQLSHYGLKANGKRGRMMVVKDVQAVDNTVSQTITSSCREEAEQIGWHQRHTKGEAEPLGTIHPAGDRELDVNPATGTPFPTGGLSVCRTGWQQLRCPRSRRLGKLLHTPCLEICQDPSNFQKKRKTL